MNFNTPEEALEAWDTQHNNLEDINTEKLEAFMLENNAHVEVMVNLPSTKKTAYLFLSVIVKTMAVAENSSVEHILNELDIVLNSNIISNTSIR